MANDLAQDYFDEGFDQCWETPMPPSLSAPCAGTKRDADNGIISPQSTLPGVAIKSEFRAEHIDPREICCPRPTCCPDSPPCGPVVDARPSKRRALAPQVSEHPAGRQSVAVPEPDAEHTFLDTCYETFCQECPPCASPECSPANVCYDPHCGQVEECVDQCVDPECSKRSCPEEPCFCSKCDAQPCPFPAPEDECQFAHSAPDPAGTVHCFSNAPCLFKHGFDFSRPRPPAYNGYPCGPPAHGTLDQCNMATNSSSMTTPALSPNTYSSLDSAFSARPSPFPDHGSNANCFLDIQGEHCHIDDSCCHGPQRACGDYPAAPLDNFGLYNLSLYQNNRMNNSNNYMPMNYGFQPHHSHNYAMDFAAPAANQVAMSSDFSNNMLGNGYNNSWLLHENTVPSHSHNMLDFLASAAQVDLNKPYPYHSSNQTPIFGSRTTTRQSSDTPVCVCKWQLSTNMTCLQTFATPEALHKHLKTSHVDNCARSFCQWDGCQSRHTDFKQRSKLSRHLLGHAGYRPYACRWEGCTKTFATNQAKENHERTHTGDRPYVCPECGYTTTTHTQLHTHISALHEKKKRHKCRFCEFTCADSSNLSKHERTHQTLRPYRCLHEGCTFKPDCRWENLKRHLRRSDHCPELLIEGSEEHKAYREKIRKETEEWQKRNGGTPESGAAGARRKGRAGGE